MALPKILYEDLSIVTYSASQATSSGHGTELLMNYRPDIQWISSNSSSQELYITFTTNTACNAIAAEGHNLNDSLTSIILQTADNAAFTTNVTNIILLEATSSDTFYQEFSSTSKRYWRLKYEPFPPSNTSLGTIPYIGILYLGSTTNFPYTYDWGYRKDNFQYITSKHVGLPGNMITNQTYNGREILELDFNFLNTTYRNQFIAFFKQIRGDLFPFVFIDHEKKSRFCVFKTGYEPLSRMKVNVNDWGGIILEAISTENIIQTSRQIDFIVDSDYIMV